MRNFLHRDSALRDVLDDMRFEDRLRDDACLDAEGKRKRLSEVDARARRESIPNAWEVVADGYEFCDDVPMMPDCGAEMPSVRFFRGSVVKGEV